MEDDKSTRAADQAYLQAAQPMLKALRAQRPFLLASDTQRIVRMAQTDLFKGLQIKSPNFEALSKP